MPTRQRAIDHIVITVPDLAAAAAAYEALGFVLTPTAQHPWGTANRLALFAGRCFLEILEIDRPEVLEAHIARQPAEDFDFGGFNKRYLEERQGASMLVLTGNDSRADAAAYAALGGHAPFDFERFATQPDGSQRRVAFSLAFASDPSLPLCGFFTCHNLEPDSFWKPEYQMHGNGAQTIRQAVLVSDTPEVHTPFLSGFTGADPEPRTEGFAFPLGEQELLVVRPEAIPDLFRGATVTVKGPHLFGLKLASDKPGPTISLPSQAAGVALAWDRP